MPDCDGLMFAAQVKAIPELAPAQLILLTSLERDDSVKSLASAGFAAYLTKPVRGRELLACIERVLEQGSSSGRFQGLVTRSSLAADQGQGHYRGRVLVVEDNVVNQQVAKRFIERLGLRGHGDRQRTARHRGMPNDQVRAGPHGRADAGDGWARRDARDSQAEGPMVAAFRSLP